MYAEKTTPKTQRPNKPASLNCCNHKYRKLSSEEIYCSGDFGKCVAINAVFYCEKCLDIKAINKSINLEEVSE